MISWLYFLKYHARKCCRLPRISMIILVIIIAAYILSSRKDNVQHKQVMNVQNLFLTSSGLDPQGFSEDKKWHAAVQLGEHVSNCGMNESCSSGSFPVHIYTGVANNDFPRLCVNGYYVFGKNLNDAGRGLNVAIINSVNFDVIKVHRFDTYSDDATHLEMFMEKYMKVDDIIIIFTYDEASTKLSDLIKKIINELGSGCIQNLKFRSSWYIVSQKGIKGFTPYEKFSLPDEGSWGKVFNERFCVTRKIVGQTIHPDAVARSNKERREFCNNYSGYGEFCSGFVADEPLVPAALIDATMQQHPIFSVPIAVLAGVSPYTLPMTLETLVHQPGINPKMVTVYYLPIFGEVEKLVQLFQFQLVKMTNIETYSDQVEFVFNKTVELYPDAGHIIFIEEELVLSPDFLMYMANTMAILDKDPTLYSISSWNDNGFKATSSNPKALYRVEGFPGLAFMISKSTYIRQMRGHMKTCCMKRPWEGWTLSSPEGMEMVVPDVSRVVHRPYEGLGPKTRMLENLFNRGREFSRAFNQSLDNITDLLMLNYENMLENLIKKSVILEMTNHQLQICSREGDNKGYLSYSSGSHSQSYVLYFKQSNSNDYRILWQLCRCFGLFYAENERPRGLHKGMLRFTLNKNDVFLVGSSSPYYRFIPGDHQPLSSME